MCTAITFKAKDNYFGRNLDFEYSFGEKVVITPRNFILKFTNGIVLKSHNAMIGMAIISDNYPLYFDATNELGLSIAGLNFPDNAYYFEEAEGKDNVASFEFIPWILSVCRTVDDAYGLLSKINITNKIFSDKFKPTPLHWIIADKEKSITVEQTKEGLKIYENPVGVLTNNPGFDFHMLNLTNYMNITAEEPQNKFSRKIKLETYSRGMGAIGLPGDVSSVSRFVRACFIKLNSVCGESETDAVNQFFHILYSVYQQNGCTKVGDGYERTNYTSCCNVSKGIYYYTTYNNGRICAVDMNREDSESKNLKSFELEKLSDFYFQN